MNQMSLNLNNRFPIPLSLAPSHHPPPSSHPLHPEEQEYTNRSSSETSRKFKVKQLLKRYRNETESPPNPPHEIPQSSDQHLSPSPSSDLKLKLFSTYHKLQAQLKTNLSLKQTISLLQSKNQELMKETKELKKVLYQVIENRKHLDKELEEERRLREELRREVEGEREERERRGREVEEMMRGERERYESLRVVNEENVREIESLKYVVREKNEFIRSLNQGMGVRMGLEREEGGKRSTEERGRKQNQEPNTFASQPENKSKPRQRERQFKVGKWNKTPTPSLNPIQPQSDLNSNPRNSYPSQQPPSLPPTPDTPPLNDDELLTIQQTKKRSLDQQLRKLTNLKKPTLHQNERIEEIEKELYRIDSNVSRLKRKIRSKY